MQYSTSNNSFHSSLQLVNFSVNSIASFFESAKKLQWFRIDFSCITQTNQKFKYCGY